MRFHWFKSKTFILVFNQNCDWLFPYMNLNSSIFISNLSQTACNTVSHHLTFSFTTSFRWSCTTWTFNLFSPFSRWVFAILNISEFLFSSINCILNIHNWRFWDFLGSLSWLNSLFLLKKEFIIFISNTFFISLFKKWSLELIILLFGWN